MFYLMGVNGVEQVAPSRTSVLNHYNGLIRQFLNDDDV